MSTGQSWVNAEIPGGSARFGAADLWEIFGPDRTRIPSLADWCAVALRVLNLARSTGSPIESDFAVLAAATVCAVDHTGRLAADSVWAPMGGSPALTVIAQPEITTEGRVLHPDFYVYASGKSGRHAGVLVECDGFDFHERTAEQGSRDRSRDRALVSDGWTVMRFLGAEIWRDAQGCVDEVLRAIERRAGWEEGALRPGGVPPGLAIAINHVMREMGSL